MKDKSDYIIVIDGFDYSDHNTPLGYLKEEYNKTQDDLTKIFIQTEIDCLNFSTWQGGVQSIFSTTDKSGLVVHEYPSLKTFSNESLDYLVSRLNSTTNTRLKAKYGQILWNSEIKQKGKHARQAIDAYFDLLKIDELTSSKQDHNYSDIINLLFLAVKSKYRIDEIKTTIIKAVVDAKPPYDEFVILVPKILSIHRYFDKSQIKSLANKGELIWQDSNQLPLLIYESIAERAIDILNVLQLKTNEWNRRLGEVYEKSIELRKDDETGMMPLHFCEKAIEYYKAAGEKNKVKSLLSRLTTLKANLKLTTIEIKFTSKELSELCKYHREVVKKLIAQEPNYVLGFLCHGVNIFPDVKFLKKIVAAKEKSFEDFANVIKYDINKNSSQRRSKQNGDITDELFEQYSWYVQIVANQFLRETFEQGLYKQKINFRTVVDFLHKHSWIGKNITYRNTGGEAYQHNWLALIAPSLLEFFIHWQSLHYSNTKLENFILCIDSLTLKFEGLLRDFARIIGTDTLVTVKGRIREAYIEELLVNERVKKYFNEDDLMLFKYVFTSAGRNARNNVAHSFYKFHHYKPELMILVIVAVLRISKYQVRVDKIVL